MLVLQLGQAQSSGCFHCTAGCGLCASLGAHCRQVVPQRGDLANWGVSVAIPEHVALWPCFSARGLQLGVRTFCFWVSGCFELKFQEGLVRQNMEMCMFRVV